MKKKKAIIGEYFDSEDKAIRWANAKNNFMGNGSKRYLVLNLGDKEFIVVSKRQFEALEGRK